MKPLWQDPAVLEFRSTDWMVKTVLEKQTKLADFGNTKGIETSTRKIVSRLSLTGWICRSGGKHDKYEHPQKPDVILILPRHHTLSIGVARDIAKKAGWI